MVSQKGGFSQLHFTTEIINVWQSQKQYRKENNDGKHYGVYRHSADGTWRSCGADVMTAEDLILLAIAEALKHDGKTIVEVIRK